VDVEVYAMPLNSDRFLHELSLPTASMLTPKPVMLDPLPLNGDTNEDLLNYKTTQRSVYQEAAGRANSSAREHDLPPPFDVLLHRRSGSSDLLTELGTSNVAVYDPKPGLPDWITPAHGGNLPFLCGVMREELLGMGLLRTGDISVDHLKAWDEEGRVIVGMNGLRGVWRAQIHTQD